VNVTDSGSSGCNDSECVDRNDNGKDDVNADDAEDEDEDEDKDVANEDTGKDVENAGRRESGSVAKPEEGDRKRQEEEWEEEDGEQGASQTQYEIHPALEPLANKCGWWGCQARHVTWPALSSVSPNIWSAVFSARMSQSLITWSLDPLRKCTPSEFQAIW